MQVVTIGNFDGVHRGHHAIVSRARELAGRSGRVTAVAFEPLPAVVLRPADAPLRLTVEPRRTELLLHAGCDRVVHLDPSIGMLQQPPEQFIAELRTRVPFDAVVEGSDFHFGHQRKGTVHTLKQLGQRMGFESVVAPEFELALGDGHVVAPRSTLIRWLLGMGRAQDAAALLGRPHEVSGTVQSGDKRGRGLGFPTANIQCAGQQLPADGVYAGIARTPRGDFAAAVSVGTKPTFGQRARACEAHLLNYTGPLDDYGWPIRLEFTRWIRGQWRFPGAEALVQQMQRDVAQCA